MFKYLQLQINLYFLYNCLFYIKNMIQFGYLEVVIVMLLSLGDYYWYIIWDENDMMMVEEEIWLFDNYLFIQQMWINCLFYEIVVLQELMQQQILRLFIQLIVENVVIYGIELSEGSGYIVVIGMLVKE